MAAVVPVLHDALDVWNALKLRCETFFEGNGLNDVAAEKEKLVLLVLVLSSQAIMVLSSRCAPQELNDIAYSEAVHLDNNLDSKPNAIRPSYRSLGGS